MRGAASFLALIPAACVALLAAAPAQGPGPLSPRADAPRLSAQQEARAQALEGRLKCPVCRVQSVRESTSFMALEMRAKVRELIAAGRSDDQILGYFVERYGDYILLEPQRRGFGIAAYALPLVAVLAGAFLLGLRARRQRGTRAPEPRGETEPPPTRGPHDPALPEAVAPEETDRVESELRSYIS
ncbi:MAG: cytochrome c-type biogenesis protein CcmH [Gemmatimonadota bacterium]